jgi:hypothetical protein
MAVVYLMNTSLLYAEVAKSNQENKIPNAWSNTVLWDSFVTTKEYAEFSYRINDQLPEYNFRIVGSFIKDRSQTEDFHVRYIDIINPSQKGKQRLNAKSIFDNDGSGWSKIDLEFADIVQLVDINFDGYRDLRVLNNTGSTGMNWYASYIYNPSSGKFKYHSELSRLPGIKVDIRNKQIVTYNRGGYCDELMEYYKVVKGNLVLVKAEWSEMDSSNDKKEDGSKCFKFIGIPNQKGRNKVKITKEPLHGSLDKRQRGPLGNPMD